MIKIPIIITTYSQRELLSNLIDSIIEHTPKGIYRIIVMDNSGGSMIPIGNGIRWVTTGFNSYIKAVNLGVKRYTTKRNELVILMNDDVVVGGNWLKDLLDVLETDRQNENWDGKFGIITPQISKVHKGDNCYYSAGMGNTNINDPLSYAETWCCLINRKAFLEVGGYDEKIDNVYAGEPDLSWKLKEAGYSIELADVNATHLISKTTSADNFYIDRHKLCSKNLEYLWEKWGNE